jgi:hypothetical protein
MSTGEAFYDDFEDNYIGDWEERCWSANWYAEDGMAQCTDAVHCCALMAPNGEYTQDCVVNAYGTAVHVFGVMARLDDSDSGVFGFVSPDHDVARIRLVSNGSASTILTSLHYDFPSYVDYELTFTCEGEDLHLLIECPSTGEDWELEAIDPYVHEGKYGLQAGDESHAYWEWFEATTSGGGGDYGILHAFSVDDDNYGQSSGDGDMAFEAGETLELGIALENTGSEPLENAFAVLQSLDPDIFVSVYSGNYGTIDPGEVAWPYDDYVISADPGAYEQQTYPMRLTVFADGGYSEAHDFDFPLGAGITCDVESGAGGWSAELMEDGWGNQWHRSDARNHTTAGSWSFKCGDANGGDYDDLLYCAEVSPLFNVPLNSELSFWIWTDAQCVRADEAYDGGRFQIGQLGNWEDLTPAGGYPYQIVEGTTGPYEPGTGVYSGVEGWQQVSLTMSSQYAGPRQLRWVFGSDASGNREGWYVDDVSVSVGTGIGERPGVGIHGELRADAFPNPFNGSVEFSLYVPSASGARIEIYDMAGRLVREMSYTGGAGEASVVWNGSGPSGSPVAPGMYMARVSCGDRMEAVRLIKL